MQADMNNQRIPDTGDQVFAYIESFTNLERGVFRPREYRLERMERLLSDFGDPHVGRTTVHLAGSKGKGSTACYVAAGVAARGYTVGLYCSPHVNDYRERISINGRAAPETTIVSCGREIYDYVLLQKSAGTSESHLPTTFELLTLLAFLIFRHENLDVQVLETGLGGRLDATNLCKPDLTLITPIEREHTEYLGNKLTGIAREKAGILKPGIPVCIAPQRPVVRKTIRTIAEQRGCPVLWDGRKLGIRNLRLSASGTEFSLRGPDGIRFDTRIRMLGAPQAENAALALVALKYLYPDETDAELLSSIAEAGLPGRMELLESHGSTGTRILLDGAHTPNSIDRLCVAATSVLGDTWTVIFGSVRGKDHTTMAERLSRDAANVIVARPGTFKPSDPESIYSAFVSHNVPTSLRISPDDALEYALSLPYPVLVCGSFYLVSEIRALCMKAGLLNSEFDLFRTQSSSPSLPLSDTHAGDIT